MLENDCRTIPFLRQLTLCLSGIPAFCGNGLTAYADDLKTVVGENPQYPDIIPHAQAIAILGKERFLRGETIRAADIDRFTSGTM